MGFTKTRKSTPVALLPSHLSLLIVLIVSTSKVSSVEIRDLSVPSYVEYGTPDTDALILDCNYDFSEAERGQLDVKWYFNGEHSPFLQWLPGRKPQVIGERFKGHIDLDFVVDESDDHKRHRAIKLVDVKPEFGGSYKCKVSTFTDEDFKQKNLVIFSPPSEVEFILENRGSHCNVTCAVYGVYPEPAISISRTTNEQGTYLLWEEDPSTPRLSAHANDSALFDSTLTVQASHTDLDNETEFTCEISLAGTEINFTESAMYYKLAGLEEVEEPLFTSELENEVLQEAEIDEVEKFAREAKEAAMNIGSSSSRPASFFFFFGLGGQNSAVMLLIALMSIARAARTAP